MISKIWPYVSIEPINSWLADDDDGVDGVNRGLTAKHCTAHANKLFYKEQNAASANCTVIKQLFKFLKRKCQEFRKTYNFLLLLTK